MHKVIILFQDKITKNTVRYAERKEQWPLQIYLQKSELPTPFPQQVKVTIEVEGQQ